LLEIKGEMALLNSAYLIFAFKVIVLMSCSNDSEKDKVRQQNKERFSDRKVQQDAQFLVNAIDASYAILEIAELGEEKLQTPLFKTKAKEIRDAQTGVAVRLKTFAEQNNMAIPLSGPEKTKNRVGDLNQMEGKEFEMEWSNQMKIHHQRLIKDLTQYRVHSTGTLKNILDSTLIVMKENKERILTLSKSSEN
jgi:predicted outer membrane protein